MSHKFLILNLIFLKGKILVSRVKGQKFQVLHVCCVCTCFAASAVSPGIYSFALESWWFLTADVKLSVESQLNLFFGWLWFSIVGDREQLCMFLCRRMVLPEDLQLSSVSSASDWCFQELCYNMLQSWLCEESARFPPQSWRVLKFNTEVHLFFSWGIKSTHMAARTQLQLIV